MSKTSKSGGRSPLKRRWSRQTGIRRVRETSSEKLVKFSHTEERTMAHGNVLVRVSTEIVVAAGVVFLGALLSGTGLTAEQEDETSALLANLPQSKHSLADGITQAEKEEGVAILAKFEMEGDELSLSVYTATPGRSADAEHNTLVELAGKPTTDQWQPKKEVFDDTAHIARASMHVTLMQLTNLTLAEVVQKAAAHQ